MNPVNQDDPILRLLARLPEQTPDAARAQRIVRRCHSAMARRERRRLRRRRLARRSLEPAVVGGFSLVYLIGMVHDLLRWYGVF